LKFDLLSTPAEGTTRASALRFERLVRADTWEPGVTRAIAPRSLFVFMTAADTALKVRLRLTFAEAAGDVRADVLTAALKFALPIEAEADAALTRVPTPDLAPVAAAGDAANALILLPIAEATACAEATFAIAPKLVCIDRASAAGATRANEPRLLLAERSAGA
jgi:hypothetical protein